ncbi:MAG: radical SAM protein [Syntrophobacteraceae bacterium]
MISSGLIPTRRAVVDINRPCNAKCRMCYYTYSQSDWSKPFEEVQKELRAALERGNTSVDFTGGEPTIYPQMAEVIRYAESIGLHTCIISNGLAIEKVKNLSEAGCKEWLLSVHGFEGRQDRLLNVKGAWEKINRTASFLNESGCFVRVNCTLTRYNYQDLLKLAKHYDEHIKPHIVNFINFNPHYEWGKHEQPEIVQRLNEVQVKASEVAPFLKQALDYLRERNYWVNVRYFPLCLLKGYERHVCNNPQVMFDPYEWDYGVSPKTTEAYLEHGRAFQRQINTRKEACGSCGMIDVCGGLHGNYAQIHGFSELQPYTEQSDYPYHFRTDLAADIIIPAFAPNDNLRNLLVEIAEKTAPPYNLTVVSKRQSAANNRNEGLRSSTNPYVIMCDDDISGLAPGWNRQLIWQLQENRDILAISARLMNQDGAAGRNTANHFDLAPPLPTVEMIPTACCIFRKTDVLFDERYIQAGWEDTDFFMQLRQKYGGLIAIANTIRVIHLNEEKNCGGAHNAYNRQLFFSKWDDNEAREQSSAEEIETPLSHLQMLCEAAKRDPKDMGAFTAFVHESYRCRRFDLLELWVKELLRAHSRAKELRYLLASCLFEQEKYEEALPVAEELVAGHPDYSSAQPLLALIKLMMKTGSQSGANGNARTPEPPPVTIPGPIPLLKLLVGPGLYDPRGNEAFLVKALKKVADVKTFGHNELRFDSVLRGLPSGWTPDSILIRDAEYYKIPPGLERAESPVFCLLGDYNLSLNQMLPVMGAFDHFFCDLKGTRIFRKLGFLNCDYFCLYGFDPEMHRDYGLQKNWDIVFVGNLNHAVQQERESLLYRLAGLKDKYRLHIATGVYGADYARMLSSSTLVFNRSIRDEANMRFFEAIACGATVLNPHIEELDLLGFSPGLHYVAYNELEEAVDDFFARWPESRKREVGENARSALREHSYERRAQDLVRKMSSIRVDISQRELRQLPEEEIQRRWLMHHSEEPEIPGIGRMGRYDPKLVGWQTHLVNNELEIRNFDFMMWIWWVQLLASSGRYSYLTRFSDEKEQLLQPFDCYREMAGQIGEWKKAFGKPGVSAGSLRGENIKEQDKGRMGWR